MITKNEEPLLSIAIPTKNRQYYCIEVIKHILSYDNNDFELVIQDNSDDRAIENFITTIDDTRLKYFYTDEAISSVENMSRSIEKTTGEYVCMIGDDDTVLPNIFEYAKYMKENNIDSVCPAYIPHYMWPNSETNLLGKLTITKSKEEIERIDVDKKLKALFSNGIINYQSYYLPRVYHGIIKKTVLNKIYNKIESYFGGLSPDIYSTVVLSSLVSNHAIVNTTFTVAGACPQSTTAQSLSGGHKGKLEDAPHLKNYSNYKWDDLIPKYYSVETIWAETAIKAARDFDLTECINSFDERKFTIAFFAKHKDGLDNTDKIDYIKFYSYIYQMRYYFKRIYEKMFAESTKKYENIDHISKCIEKCI